MSYFKCPKCGTDGGCITIDGWDDELSNGIVFVDVVCTHCKTEYTNVYRFDHSEITYEEDEWVKQTS